ncbi:hypothetical protein SH449x_000669 [Pirellulaceae bacterium SH449]
MIRHSHMREMFALVSLVLVASLAGCTSTRPTSDYGASEGATSRTSPDGLAIMRQMCIEQNLAVTTVGSLPANGERKLSTIVWLPHQIASHREEPMNWIARWLASGGKTLVYVGRDYSPNADYWELTQGMLGDRDAANDAGVNAALERASLVSKQVSAKDYVAYPWGWYQKKLGEHKQIDSLEGDWSQGLEQLPINIKLRNTFRAWSEVSDSELEQVFNKQVEPATSNQSSNATPTAGSQPSSSSQPSTTPVTYYPWMKSGSWGEDYLTAEKERRAAPTVDSEDVSAEMESDEDFLERVAEWEDDDFFEEYVSPPSEGVTHEVVLRTADGQPLITVVTKSQWKGSRIVLLANSSLISNLSLTYDGNRLIASKLIDTFSPGRVGFLSAPNDPVVLDGDSGTEGLLSLLTLPVNLLVAHLVLLGLVALFCLWPIFGRPAELPALSTQSFSQHISALGSLLQKTGDQFYARTTIADYFRHVKKDPNSAWAQLDAEYRANSASPFRQDDANSPTKSGNG